MDGFYVRNVNFTFSVKIFFKTIATVLKQKGMFVEDE